MVGTMEQPSIIAIDKVSVARICSGQVITDLATAVKELVENSLDAGAKHVEVKLKEFGLDSIEVSDNGSGVSPSNYEGLALKYHTSKLSTFSDLSGVRSFGFRGEALSSLCELAGTFSVTTRTTDESVGVKLTYGRDGKLLGKETAPRQMGTTVSISNMFEPLPVRRGEFKRNIKKQYNKLLRGMQAYALISLGVRITVTNTKAKGGKQTLIGTQYNNKLGDNVTNVFGAKFLATLSPADICLDDKGKDDDTDNSEQGRATPAGTPLVEQGEAASSAPRKAESVRKRRIRGMVSKAGEGVGRSDNDRQFLYLNGRPVDMPKFSRTVNEVWRAYEMKQKPAFVLDVRLPPGSFDVNVTPDKREIFMTEESEMVDRLKKALHELWAPSRYTIPVNQGQLTQARLTDKAFTSQDTSVKSPPAPAVGGTSRVGIVSPEALNDLAAVDAAAADHDDNDVVPVSSRAMGSKASKRAAAAAGGGERLIEEPQGGAETNVRGAAEEKREAEVERSESGNGGGVDGPDVVPTPKGSPHQSRPEESSGASGDTLPLPTADKQEQGQEQTPKHSSTKKRLSSESCRSRKAVAGVVVDTSLDAATGDGRREAEGGDVPPGPGELESEGEQSPRGNNRGDGATKSRGKESGGSSRAEAMTPDGVDTATASPAQGVTGGTGSEHMAAGVAPGASLSFDMQSVLRGCRKASRLKRKRDERNASAHSFSGRLSSGGAELQDSKAAERTFSRVLNKEHFTQMRVVGQFNLGFAICLLGSDLFILDQHACDEKYNFEVLQETTTIHQQPLVRPLPLETTASEEMSIIDNMAIFEKNGFRFTVDDDQPTTKKLKITAVPFTKGTQFGVDDVHELASIVAENNSPGEMVRLPKARAMFASRACRSSIMIGTALDRGQMERVVAKMATIEQPWNCPHGRPTMRHLADVSKSLRAAAGLDPLFEG